MSRFRTVLACAVAAVFAFAGCQESGQLVEPESSSVDAASGAVDGAAVTTASCDITVDDDDGESIQTDGVDAVSDGGVVCVAPGTYTGDVTVDKDITLRGTTDPSGSSAAVVDGQLAVNGSGAGATVAYLKIAPTTTFTVGTGIDPFGIRVTVSDVLVAGNVVSGLTGDATGGSGSGTVHGIQVWNGGEPYVTDVTVRDNTILDIQNLGAASLGWPNYGGAAGVKVQGVVRDIAVTGNHVRGVHSAGWVYGVTLTHTGNDPQKRSPENVTIEGNTLAELNDGSVYDVFTHPTSAPYPGAAVAIDDTENPDGPGGADADQATVAFNNFLASPIGAQNKDEVHTLVAECNYWGHASGPSDARNQADKGASAVGEVDYRPWSVREIGLGANPGKSCVGGKHRGGGNGQ